MRTQKYAFALLIALHLCPLYQVREVQAETRHKNAPMLVKLTGQGSNLGLPLPGNDSTLASVVQAQQWNHLNSGNRTRHETDVKESITSTNIPVSQDSNTLTSSDEQNDHSQQLQCMALNVYFEARGESEKGKRAVAHVVMNRLNHRKFPDTVCAVVQQGGEKRRYRCQFSWWCDGRSDIPGKNQAWIDSTRIAREVYMGDSIDPTEGALWYHAEYVSPYWRTAFQQGPQIGQHIFYLATR